MHSESPVDDRIAITFDASIAPSAMRAVSRTYGEKSASPPITLSVAAMEIGRRVGASVVGVGVPSHFLVRDAQHDVYGDPFHEGAVMDRAEPRVAQVTSRVAAGGGVEVEQD